MALLTTCARCLLRDMARWRLGAWLLGLTLLGSAGSNLFAQQKISDEDQVKAVFLFNFAQFVEWPRRAFREPETPFTIGILGEDPFGSYLDDLVKGEKVGGRTLTVRRWRRIEDALNCHILFVSRSEGKTIDRIIARLKGQSILTVSDLDTFTRQGGIVRFATESGKIRLRINVEAAKACELTISSKILRPGTIATPARD